MMGLGAATRIFVATGKTVSVWFAPIDVGRSDLPKGWRLHEAYFSSKSFVCCMYLFLGLVQSRTISSMVLPELMLLGCSSRMLLSVVLSANES
jgi:hypothetical protein